MPAVDLDLYVTTPDARTIYFASAATIDGTLRHDVACGDPLAPGAPCASETVVLRTIAPGTYRVGVDFVDVCAESPAPVAFDIAADLAGIRQETSGTITPGEFRPAALEFVVPADRGAAHGDGAE